MFNSRFGQLRIKLVFLDGEKELGNDVNISFWKDWWIGEQPYCISVFCS